MEPSYEIADARVRAVGGMSSDYLSAFVTWLGSQQYSAGYACIVARHESAFGRWCEARGIEVSALTDGEIERYLHGLTGRKGGIWLLASIYYQELYMHNRLKA